MPVITCGTMLIVPPPFFDADVIAYIPVCLESPLLLA
jgi:hypothetical protein